MNTEALKQKVDTYRDSCRKKEGSGVLFSETGPASLSLIDALVEVIVAQEKRIADLEHKTRNFTDD